MKIVIDFSKKKDKIRLWQLFKTFWNTKIITIEETTRKKNWNRYYWGVVIKIIMNHTGYEKLELHELFTYMFAPEYYRDGRIGEFILCGSTSAMNQKEFEEYVEAVKRFAAQYFSDEENTMYIPNIEEFYEV